METEHRGCLSELYLAETRFQKTAWLINERSKCHHDEIQPLLEKAGLIAGENYITNKNYLIDTLGNRLATKMSRLTDDMIEFFDNTLPSLQKTSDKLHAALKNIYPDRKIINFTPLKNAEGAQ